MSEVIAADSAVCHYISTFYKFKELTDVEKIREDLLASALELGVRGILILGTEGFNTTCSCKTEEGLLAWKSWIENYFGCPGLFYKDSVSEVAPFRRFVVKIREEIVTTGIPGVLPPEGKNQHLSPAEWNQMMKEDSDHVVIDTRNWYEYKIGTFKGAINPNIEKFTEFPEFMEQQGIDKEKNIMIFCTGGIRCEKGILELQQQGYKNVYQLEGGIINYIKEFPNDQYEGECFVFDHRVALDQELNPSKQYKLCPHCGQPGSLKISCARCDTDEIICESCAQVEIINKTCSKNCAHHYKLRPNEKGKRQIVPFEVVQTQNKELHADQ